MTDNEIKLAKLNGTQNELYEQEVNRLVRLKYSQSEENAILRKKIAGLDAKDEFSVYSAYVEECKKEIKEKVF